MNDKKILVVDDEKVVRVTLSDLLSKEGYEVESADSGKAAIEKTKVKKYDVVILDVILPDMNGIEILSNIKRRSPSTQVVIITGFGTIEDAVRAVKIGAYDYVGKPFKKGEIQSLVKRVLEETKLKEQFQKRSLGGNGIEIFKKMMGYDSPGLCITTRDPDELQKESNIPVEYIVKLDKLNDILMEVNNFVKDNKSAAVLLFGFEDLLEKYSAEQLKEFVVELSAALETNGAHLVVAYNESSMDLESFESFVHEVSEAHTFSVFNILASPIRRESLLYLESQGKSIFTKIQRNLGVENAPNLSFHLRNLKSVGFVEEDSEKRYFLTDMGKEVCGLLKRFEVTGVKKFGNIIWANTD